MLSGSKVTWSHTVIGQMSQITVWAACPITVERRQVTELHQSNTITQKAGPSHVSSQHLLVPSLLPSFLPPYVSPDTGRQDSFWTHQPNSPGARARDAGVPLNTRQDWQSDRKRARPKHPVLPHCEQKIHVIQRKYRQAYTDKKIEEQGNFGGFFDVWSANYDLDRFLFHFKDQNT